MKGFIYPEGFHTERKPNKPAHVGDQLSHEENMNQYTFDLAEWHKCLLEVKWNLKIVDFYGKTMIGWRLAGWSPDYYKYVAPGSPCEYDEKTKSITRIL